MKAWKAMIGLKGSDPAIIDLVAQRLSEQLAAGRFEGFFGDETLLIPAPGHAPSQSEAQQSNTLDLAKAMERYGLGKARRWLSRVRKVPKAAWAQPGQRPTPLDHYKTIRLGASQQLGLGSPAGIIIVDDVVTSGATLYAAACRLRERFPKAHVFGFAAVRTLSNARQIDTVLDPVDDGSITLRFDGLTKRTP